MLVKESLLNEVVGETIIQTHVKKALTFQQLYPEPEFVELEPKYGPPKTVLKNKKEKLTNQHHSFQDLLLEIQKEGCTFAPKVSLIDVASLHSVSIGYDTIFNGVYSKLMLYASIDEHSIGQETKEKLPGMNAMVECPVCPTNNGWYNTRHTLWRAIQHLNDGHRWTREKIANWLDELHDSGQVNIEFPTPERIENYDHAN